VSGGFELEWEDFALFNNGRVGQQKRKPFPHQEGHLPQEEAVFNVRDLFLLMKRSTFNNLGRLLPAQ